MLNIILTAIVVVIVTTILDVKLPEVFHDEFNNLPGNFDYMNIHDDTDKCSNLTFVVESKFQNDTMVFW